ncbi:hypothetical protein bthur0012_30770 [Bacillus thuringiensis serovar pulsiensis BGSC 4CC1]|nr:hypothetical protein bthur0012_30770 [Bacillus thuringiensis serovar pulsiensis BGSC 4CC1]
MLINNLNTNIDTILVFEKEERYQYMIVTSTIQLYEMHPIVR